MLETQGLFDTVKKCEFCGKALPKTYKEALCPSCKDHKLFHDVKDYIRSHNCNEYQVAEEFHIPLSRVKEWIRDGRIEYREASAPGISSMHCQHCGASVTFGTLCQKCLKVLNSNKGYAAASFGSSEMHYLDSRTAKSGDKS